MANQLCDCGTGLGNTGLPNCEGIFGAMKKFITVPQFTNAGVENCIDPSGTLNLAWLLALTNNVDKSVRLFPSPPLKDVDMAKAEPFTESAEDDSSNFVAEKSRKVKAKLFDTAPRYKANFESARCNANTFVYGVDLFGNLIGCAKYGDGKLYPIPTNARSFHAAVIMAKDAASQQLGLSFEIPAYFNDSTLKMISAAKFTNFNMLDVAGLLDGNVVFSAIGAGTVTATITTPGSTLNDPIPVEGLVVADFVSSVTGATSKIRNTTDSADVAITAVVETSPGVYLLTYTLAAAKVVVVKALLQGFDFASMVLTNYTTV